MIIGINGYIGSGKDTVGSIIQYLTEYPNSKNQTDGKNRSYNSYVMDVGMGHEPSWEIKKFAEKLKQIASMLTGIPREKFEDQEFKKTYLPVEWNYDKPLDRDTMLQEHKHWETVQMTVREFLQKLGTEAIRDGLHTNAWVNALFADYTLQDYVYHGEANGQPVYPNWIVTDTRFPNEAKAIEERGGIIIRVNRFADDRFQKLDLGELGTKYAVDKSSLHPSETSLDNWEFDHVIDNNGTIEELIEKVRAMLIKFKII